MGIMQHAGFDNLHNPLGTMYVIVSLLFLTGIIIGGSFLFKAGQKRENILRAQLRKEHEESKKPK